MQKPVTAEPSRLLTETLPNVSAKPPLWRFGLAQAVPECGLNDVAHFVAPPRRAPLSLLHAEAGRDQVTGDPTLVETEPGSEPAHRVGLGVQGVPLGTGTALQMRSQAFFSAVSA